MRRARLGDGATLAVLYAATVVLRWPLRASLPYGDEGMHYGISRLLDGLPATITDVEGGTWIYPHWIFWERPLFALLLHPFAVHGFAAFRVGYILLASLLPLATWWMVRTEGATRWTAGAVGAAVAAHPIAVTWGALGMMDELMAAFVALGWAWRRRGRHGLSAFAFLLACWAKETAWALVVGIALFSFGRAYLRGLARVHPLTVDRPTSWLLIPLTLGLVPLGLSLVEGLNNFGGHAGAQGAWLFDYAYVTPWFLPLLLAGLAWHRSRALCALAFAFPTSYLLSHAVLGRSVEAWYLAGSLPFVLCGVALAVQEWIRTASDAWMRAASKASALTCVAILLTIVLIPAGPVKGEVLHPVSRLPEDSWTGTVRYETRIRDHALQEALDLMQLDGTQEVLTVDVYYGRVIPMAGPHGARHVYIDSAQFRQVIPLWIDSFAARAETNGTWLLVGKSDAAFFHAINEAYVSCRVLDNAEFRLYEAWKCPGGQEALEQGFRSRHLPAGAPTPVTFAPLDGT